MNRKEIRGRASLSFPAAEGFLDVNQILETDPWNQIDDFVQCNFIQNVLDEFNERMTLDPKRTPADSKRSTDKRPTPSSRGTRKSQADLTNKGKKKADKAGGPKSKEHKTEIAKKSESSKTKGSNGYEEKERINISKEKGDKLRAIRKPPTKEGRKKVENSLKKTGKKQSTATPVKQNEKEIANVSTRSAKSVVSANSENENRINTSTPRSGNSKLLKAKTPMSELSKISNSPGKECAIETNNVTAVGKKFSATGDVSIKKTHKRRKCATRDFNNNCNELEPAEKENKNAAVICENEGTTKKKVTEKKGAPRSRQSETLKCNTRDRKIAAGEKKKVGKFEQRLLDKRERREERKTHRHERKAERAMEKFSHHVMRIVRKMGYLSEHSSSSCSEDGDGYCDSTGESSYSDSCCSNSSCSCCTSCSYSSEYSEYSLCSSSN